MSKKGYDVLKAICDEQLAGNIQIVIGSNDPNVLNDYYEDIRSLCLNNGIPHVDRKLAQPPITKYSIAISWRWLIRLNESQLIVLHDSLLPKYRGFAPLVNMLINGETKIGVSALFAEKNYDVGPVISQSSSDITYPIKIADAIDIISENYKKCALEIIKKIIYKEKLPSEPQDESKATYSLWRDEEDYIIDWNKNSEFIVRFINAVSYPYSGASSYLQGKKIRITDAEVYPDKVIEIRQPGKVIFVENGFPVIVCKTGLVKITALHDDLSKENLLPLKNFRVRFK